MADYRLVGLSQGEAVFSERVDADYQGTIGDAVVFRCRGSVRMEHPQEVLKQIRAAVAPDVRGILISENIDVLRVEPVHPCPGAVEVVRPGGRDIVDTRRVVGAVSDLVGNVRPGDLANVLLAAYHMAFRAVEIGAGDGLD